MQPAAWQLAGAAVLYALFVADLWLQQPAGALVVLVPICAGAAALLLAAAHYLQPRWWIATSAMAVRPICWRGTASFRDRRR